MARAVAKALVEVCPAIFAARPLCVQEAAGKVDAQASFTRAALAGQGGTVALISSPKAPRSEVGLGALLAIAFATG